MKIACVCGTGQGSSLILRMSVEDILKEKGYKADIEHTDTSNASSGNYDFIITSKEIADSIMNPRAEILIITNYINKEIIKEEIADLFEYFENK